MGIMSVYNYAELHSKQSFADHAMAFLKKACEMAGVKPDLINAKASPVKRYPYFNPGGHGVLGDVYCKVTRADGTTLEIVMGESGLYHRTVKNGNDYGPNLTPCGFGRRPSKDFSEEDMGYVITQFLAKR